MAVTMAVAALDLNDRRISAAQCLLLRRALPTPIYLEQPQKRRRQIRLAKPFHLSVSSL
jgi:hypothetical protein